MGATKWRWGGGLPGCSCLPKSKLKTTYFVDILISNSLRDLLFSRNQPLKSADDQHLTILRNKVVTLECLR